MSAARNKAVVRRYLEGLGRGDFTVFDDFVKKDLHWHGPMGFELQDRDIYRELLSGGLSGFSDFSLVIEDQMSEGDKVVSRLTVRGVTTGGVVGYRATSQTVTRGAIQMHRLENGRIAEEWLQEDVYWPMPQFSQPASC